MSQPTFTLASSSGTNFFFPKPEWDSANNEISKTVDLFNFWKNDDVTTVDKGINGQPMVLEGTICICSHWEGVCFPLCPDSLCFTESFTTFLNNLKRDMNNGEEFTINELGNCINGVYVIRNFSFDTINRVPSCYKWRLELERVRDVS